jgi:hypothetical protein
MPIFINKKTDKFFIAIAKEADHSFIMFGIYDQNQVEHLLCRVGKFVAEEDEPDSNGCVVFTKRLFSAFFSSVKARLTNERTFRNKEGNIPISYQAYEATYEQYLNFIRLLENRQTEENAFPCYKPVASEGDSIVLEKTSECIYTPDSAKSCLKEDMDELSIDNTCRHTAIKLIEEIQQERISSQISSEFFVNLPYSTQLKFGVPSTDIPFYVLPPSPLAYPDLGDVKFKIIKKLYHRMEELLLTEGDSIQTANKFNCLKDLYNEITGPQKELSLNELLGSIQSWRQEHKTVLNQLRKTYFWDAFFKRESATMTLVKEIEQDLQQEIRFY